MKFNVDGLYSKVDPIGHPILTTLKSRSIYILVSKQKAIAIAITRQKKKPIAICSFLIYCFNLIFWNLT